MKVRSESTLGKASVNIRQVRQHRVSLKFGQLAV